MHCFIHIIHRLVYKEMHREADVGEIFGVKDRKCGKNSCLLAGKTCKCPAGMGFIQLQFDFETVIM
jgi:hypothetical protein